MYAYIFKMRDYFPTKATTAVHLLIKLSHYKYINKKYLHLHRCSLTNSAESKISSQDTEQGSIYFPTHPTPPNSGFSQTTHMQLLTKQN